MPITFINNEPSVLDHDNLPRLHTRRLRESSEGPGGTASPRNGSVECGVVTPIGFSSLREARVHVEVSLHAADAGRAICRALLQLALMSAEYRGFRFTQGY